VQVAESVRVDRKHQIEAAVVRTMKARRAMPHAELVAEAHGRSRGAPPRR
jgi:hypothetical protein